MKRFVKLNFISTMYAFALFIQFQPVIQIYRIVRITGLPIGSIQKLIFIFNLIAFIISTIILFFITKKYFNREKLRYLLTILWMPYYIAFTVIFNFLFPITVRGDEPAPVLGLLLIVAFFIYPICIALIILFSSIENLNV